MSLKNKKTFTNSTAYMKRNDNFKNQQSNMTLLEDINLTPVSKLDINTYVGPSEYSATHV